MRSEFNKSSYSDMQSKTLSNNLNIAHKPHDYPFT
jgi:hypothetical protein